MNNPNLGNRKKNIVYWNLINIIYPKKLAKIDLGILENIFQNKNFRNIFQGANIKGFL